MTGGINHQNDGFSIVVDKSIASVIHQHLASGGYINNDYVIKDLGQHIAIPVTNPVVIRKLDWFDEEKLQFETIILEPKKSTNTPAQEIVSKIEQLLVANSLILTKEMVNFLPKKWELFSDLAIVPSDSLNSKEWQDLLSKNEALSEEIWQIIADSLKVSRIARQSEIANDKLRSSQVKMIVGDSGEVEFVDYGVKFWLDVTKVMFSSGNVTERHRIGSIDMTGEVVVDAFSGIGYYTLPMLVRSNAKHVYACELNPNSIDALTKGADLNAVSDRLTIIEGDNQITLKSLSRMAERVHLGILPSSENTWQLAIDCLKQSGGIIHIHMNVRENEISSFVDYCLERMKQYAVHREFNVVELIHLEKVKWYAPHIRHIVIDVSVK
ncbi:MAG: class I SAM-dependent methyltransferase [Candidatus Poseidoniaceae archaeon]